MVVSKDLIEGDNSLVFSFENIKDGKNTKVGKDPKYVFAVLLIKKIPPADLIKKIAAESSLPVEKGKAKFEERFVLGRDKEIEMNEIKIDILDNVSLTPISLPARGVFCDHPQCFSLDTFVKSMANEARRKWACPVCKRRSPRFVIDLFVEQQIKEALKTDRSIEQILFHKDGAVSYPASKSKKDALKQLQVKREAQKAQPPASDQPHPDLANASAALVEVLSIGSNENDMLEASPRETAEKPQGDPSVAKARTGDYLIESKSPSHRDAVGAEKKSAIEDEKKSEKKKQPSTGTTSANESNKQPEAVTPMDPLSQLKLVEDKRFIQHLYSYLSKYAPRADQPRGFFDYHQAATERCRDSYYLSKYIDLLHKFVLEKKGLAVLEEDAVLGKRLSEDRNPPSPAYFLQTEHNHSSDL